MNEFTTDRASTRVSLREIREATFRALSAAGASSGEAATAARMVLDAELNGKAGIEAVLRDLESGAWVREGIHISESDSPVADTLRLSAGTNRLLQHTPLAVDLAASEVDLGGVFVPIAVAGIPCLDTLLLCVAESRGSSVGVLVCRPGQSPAVRVATADGSLGSGQLVDGSENQYLEDHEEGLLFTAPAPQSWRDSVRTWVNAEERADRRSAAASDGCLVDAEQWSSIYAAARRYLVG